MTEHVHFRFHRIGKVAARQVGIMKTILLGIKTRILLEIKKRIFQCFMKRRGLCMWEVGVSLAPLIIIFILLFLLKQTVVRAGLGAYVFTVLLTFVAPSFTVSTADIFTSTIQGILISSIVAYVLLFGILLFHLMKEAGAIEAIATFVSNATQDPVRQVLLLVVAFSPLVESASGFGIAIIVVAPIMVALGFSPFKATMLALVSLSAVPWGALATGTVIGATISGIPLHDMGSGSALLSVPTFFYFAFVAVYLANGWQGIKARWAEVIAVAASLSVSVWLFSTYVSVELAGVFAALVAIGIQLLFIRLSHGQTCGQKLKQNKALLSGEAQSEISVAEATEKNMQPKHHVQNIVLALSPYLFLTLLLLLSRLVPFVEHFLRSQWVIDLPAYSFTLPVLYSPGFILLLACLFTILIFQTRLPTIRTACHHTLKQWVPVVLTTIFFVATSEVMFVSGMTSTLAQATAAAFGTAFMFLSPLLGGMGGFLTGTNTAANAMFIHLQMQTAQQLDISAELFAYANNVSSAHLTMASPSRILLGASVCGIPSAENELLAKTILIALGSLVLVAGGMILLSLF